MIVFKRIKYKNFMAAGNAGIEVQFNTHPTTLVVGKNGSGKSTAGSDALTFALYGKPYRNISKAQLVNSINGKDCVVEVEFDIGPAQYKVVRGMKPNIFEIYLNGNMITQEAATKDYQKYLEQQILRISYKTFTQVVILGTATFEPFMKLPSSSRREVIEDILDIKIFTVMNQILKLRVQETKDSLIQIGSQIELFKTKIESQKRILEHISTSRKENTAAIRQKIQETQDTIDVLEEKLVAAQTEASQVQERISAMGDVTSELDKARRLMTRRETHCHEIDGKIKFFNENESCPTCSQTISPIHSGELVANLTEDKSKIQDELLTLNHAIDLLGNRFKERGKALDELTMIQIQISGFNSEMSAHMKTIKALNDELGVDAYAGDVEAEKIKLKEMAVSAQDLLRKKTELLTQRTINDLATQLLKDSGIKARIISEYLPIINTLVNKYLHAQDSYIQFELDEQFNETIKSRHRDAFTYASFSEGEKQRIDTALLFTWRQIAKLKNSASTNLLVLDEILDSHLDPAGLESVMNLINETSQEGVHVFCISHSSDVYVDKFSNVLRFDKKNEYSVLEE